MRQGYATRCLNSLGRRYASIDEALAKSDEVLTRECYMMGKRMLGWLREPREWPMRKVAVEVHSGSSLLGPCDESCHHAWRR